MENESKIQSTLFDRSPLQEIECACGCGEVFVPKRRDQKHLNRRHTNYAYNHGTRKDRDEAKTSFVKQLSKNDSVLGKYFNAKPGDIVDQYLDVLKADGFDSGFCCGGFYENKVYYYMSFNYAYTTWKKNEILMIKIKKR